MTTWIWILLGFIICQRLVELVIAKGNEAWMLRQGGIERGAEHHKWFVVVHVLFFISILVECLIRNKPVEINYVLFTIFVLTQVVRIWCIASLGKFWNTKVIILPGATLRTSGPYSFVKHPNYIIVGIELFVIPLLLGAPLTAVIFPFFHIFLLIQWRLPVEEEALAYIRTIEKR